MCMPWFQGQNPFPSNYPYGYEHARRMYHNKRKGDDFDEVPAPAKQYISEEAMSARMNQMHISNNYTPMPSCSSSTNDLDVPHRGPIRTLQELEARLQDESLDLDIEPGSPEPPTAQLVLSPEIAEIKPEPILPRSIVNQLQKPAMEIVLWKPPGGLVEDLIRSVLDSGDQNENTEKKNANKQNKMDSAPTQYPPLPNFNRTNYNSGKGFQNFRSYTIPAMSQHEIESLVEEMNV